MFELWLKAFFITVFSELLLIPFLLPRVSRARLVLSCLFVNSLSHPFLWFIFPRFLPYALWLACGEFSVVMIEAVLYWMLVCRERGFFKAFLASLGANAASCLLGFIFL